MVKKRGRPKGHKLSEESKKAISESKKGQRHSPETKDKISRSLIIYFRKLNTLSDEFINKYCRVGDDKTCDWITNVEEDFDETADVLTEKNMRSVRQKEICCGHNIEYFSHELTPEVIVLFKEFCKENGLDPMEVLDVLDEEEDKWQRK
jgi:hypothetical protein